MPQLSLSDRFFLPIFVLIGAGLIYTAMQIRPVGSDPVLTGNQLVFEGAALSELIPGPGTGVTFDPSAPGGAVARATATASIDSAGNLSAGVGAVVPAEFESAVLGREIEVSISLRADDAEHTEVAIGYFVVGRGDSGWHRQEIPTDGSPLILRHRIPLEAPTGNNDWIGIWPDLTGSGRTVVIDRIAVSILPEADNDNAGPTTR